MSMQSLLAYRSRRALVLAGIVASLLAALMQPLPVQAAGWFAA